MLTGKPNLNESLSRLPEGKASVRGLPAASPLCSARAQGGHGEAQSLLQSPGTHTGDNKQTQT